jgi:hypothetical protein
MLAHILGGIKNSKEKLENWRISLIRHSLQKREEYVAICPSDSNHGCQKVKKKSYEPSLSYRGLLLLSTATTQAADGKLVSLF